MRKSIIHSNPKGIAEGKVLAFYQPLSLQPSKLATVIVPTTQFKGFSFAARYQYLNDLPLERYEITDLFKIPYPLNKPLYVREKMIEPGKYYTSSFDETGEYETRFFCSGPMRPYEEGIEGRVISAAQMPRSSACTWIEITSVDVVRVQDIGYAPACKFLEFDYSEGQQFKNYARDWNQFNSSQFQLGDYRESLKSYHIAKYGQSSWENNEWQFLYHINIVKHP